MRATILSLVVLSVIAGCTERKAHLAARSGEVVLARAPSPEHALDIAWGDKVELVGYDVDTQTATPDRAFKVVWYWRVRAPLGDGVQLFTHLADAKGATVLNLDAQRAMRESHPEAKWRAGEYIRDEQIVTLPANWTSPEAVFYLGFYRGAQRFEITRGKHDAERRAEALRVPVAIAKAPEVPPPPILKAQRVTQPLKIDGKLDEPAWQSTGDTGAMVRTMTGAPGEFRASARVLYDDQRMYVGFDVSDAYLKSTFDRADDHLWEQDCVEIMWNPSGDGRNYFELQVSPRSVHFDTRYDSRRNPRPFGHVDWDSRVQAKALATGTPNDDAADEGYVVELAVPWAAFATGDPPASPPKPGSTWRVNFFVMDARAHGQKAVGWSPPRVGDFHILDRFGVIEFAP